MKSNLSTESAAKLPFEDVCSHLDTDFRTGLSTTVAKFRQSIHGYNELSVTESTCLLFKYFEQFKNPLIFLLFCSAFVSVIMHQYDDAFSITMSILIVVTVGFVQEYRSEKSLEELNKLVPPLCRCLRDGCVNTFYARFLVPGDIVLLSTGDRVPADLRLIESNDLIIDESTFTGETEPTSKTSAQVNVPMKNGMANKNNIAFMGTLVCAGNGRGVVINTGHHSEFGGIFKMMQSEESPKTPLQKSMDSLGKTLSLYSFGIIFVIMFLGFIQGRPLMEMFTISVSLAVAAIPEGLPIVVTVTLALGVIRMAKQNAVIKRLPTVETLGCTNVICTDKTGTLTRNEMTVTQIVSAEMYQAEVTGVGYLPDGQIIGVTDSHQYSSLRRVLEVGCVCNNAEVFNGRMQGQPTEAALIVAAQKFQMQDVRSMYTRDEEMPFSSEQKIMAVRVTLKPEFRNSESIQVVGIDGDMSSGKYFVKGALEKVLSYCTSYCKDGFHESLNQNNIEAFMKIADDLSRKGLRGKIFVLI